MYGKDVEDWALSTRCDCNLFQIPNGFVRNDLGEKYGWGRVKKSVFFKYIYIGSTLFSDLEMNYHG